MSRTGPDTDDDNPEWTEADFAAARPASELPREVLAAFPKTRARRGPQKAPTKVKVSILLSPDVVAHYRAGGRGWQARLDADLRKTIRNAS